MNRRKFISQSIGVSIAGPAIISELSGIYENRIFSYNMLPPLIKSPQETKLIVKPVMTNMYHTDMWEGPCRFNVVSSEQEKKNALASYENFKKGSAQKTTGSTVKMSPCWSRLFYFSWKTSSLRRMI
jgi:hypothetical protein